jgi:GalNAc-alpha-(1->4)-GalNAc-alpha-(1->3)-diNAcBac-PP-undecaprenol alpha-1,4-N-acetyl-D-galactosaminyltransferase
MRLLFVTPRLSAGGAERVLEELTNALAARGHEVIVLSLGAAVAVRPLNQGVQVIALHLMGASSSWIKAIANNMRLLKAIRVTVRRLSPDFVISFLDRTNVRVLLATAGLRVRVVVTEHSYPGVDPIGFIWGILRYISYRLWVHTLVSVSRGIDECFDWLDCSRRAIIPNPIPTEQIGERADSVSLATDRRHVVSVGRLVPVKGFDVLLRAFATVAKQLPDWDLVVIGDGPERSQLQRQAKLLGLENQLIMPGEVSNVFEVLRRCDIFCMSSKSEGFGLVLIEAMHCGLAVVSTDCPIGPRDFLKPGINGVLVPVDDWAAMGRAIYALARDPSRREVLGESARKTARNYSLETVIPKWESLFDGTESLASQTTHDDRCRGEDKDGHMRRTIWRKPH